MLTLSLVFEDRDEYGDLKEYAKYELDPRIGITLCCLMLNGDNDFDDDLLRFVEIHNPEEYARCCRDVVPRWHEEHYLFERFLA